MSGQDIFFYVFSALAVAFSLLVVLGKNPIYSALSLVMVFFCVAANFVLLQAQFIATIQVLVYAGAIMVLFIFVIMLLNADAQSADLGKRRPFQAIAAVLCVALFALFAWSVKNGTTSPERAGFTPEKVASLGGNTQVLSELMFSDYILPFELTSLLLLVGIAGSVAIAKRKLEGARAESPKEGQA
ncbi:MAG: NADH-quinone oxidoreductase subunit J [Deltaproteobacteria bacterium]|nr:NADH-quinone oxidoreductase subunit J [Deltaproteobacteria bacterium]